MTKVLTKPLTMPAVDMVAFKKEVIKKGPHAKKNQCRLVTEKKLRHLVGWNQENQKLIKKTIRRQHD